MIISLTGFMGCGKSSVGRKLSELLCCPFMDLDDIIEERAGRRIPEIFASEGEAEFRRMEAEALEAVTGQQPKCSGGPLPLRGPLPLAGGGKMPPPHNGQTVSSHENSEGKTRGVLALGGGAVMTPSCAKLVHEHTLCIYLRASVETLLAHLSGEADGRPMLEGRSLRSRIEELMTLRSSTYEKTAHIIIDTDGKSIDYICQEIISTAILPGLRSSRSFHGGP